MSAIALNNRSALGWRTLLAQVDQALQARSAHPARSVVLLPFAQLMPLARSQWLAWQAGAGQAAGFVPRFETTMNWAANPAPGVAAWQPTGDDLRFDAAADALTAASLLRRAGLGAQAGLLAPALLEAALSLAALAAAQPPAQRSDWSQGLRLALQQRSQGGPWGQSLALEQAVQSLALAWVGSSGFASDVLQSPAVQAATELLVVVQGLQTEPVALALAALAGERALCLPWPQDATPVPAAALHSASDAQDEAERAAAAVLVHLQAQRRPVGLCATDRALTRRVRALLERDAARTGLSLRDETGWKLSTTRAAASLMALLRAGERGSDDNALVNLAKLAPALDSVAVTAWERGLHDVPKMPSAGVNANQLAIKNVANEVWQVRQALRAARPLQAWLADVAVWLDRLGLLGALQDDPAGQQVLQALHLDAPGDLPAGNAAWSLADFMAWANQALEAGSFVPEPPADPDVIVLPLSQVLGRPLAALVLPGCDELNLPAVPELPGPWTRAQRELLGLPSREAVQAQQQASWQLALQVAPLDLLWRRSHEGRPVQRSSLLQALQLRCALPEATDPRPPELLQAQPVAVPQPGGAALPLTQLSASAYATLRACPYQFFALRLLGLRAVEELDEGLKKREFGTWLHAVLRQFHESHQPLPDEFPAQLAMLNGAAEQVTQAQQWSEAEFLPFASMWPRVRDAYLAWLAEHRAGGAEFAQAEAGLERAHAGVRLVGKLDRVDQLPGGAQLVIDYKTENAQTTAKRVKEPLEDTQLAFYAALLQPRAGDQVQALYLNLGEGSTRAYPQHEVLAARDALLEGIRSDLAGIAAGQLLAPLGEGRVCELCDARGLCRKDWWAAP